MESDPLQFEDLRAVRSNVSKQSQISEWKMLEQIIELINYSC